MIKTKTYHLITGNFRGAKMKINAINSNIQQKRNNNTKFSKETPSFKAKVTIHKSLEDIISGVSYPIKLEGALLSAANKLAKILEKFDDNLIIDISGTKKFTSFLDIFRDKLGLKIDIRYFDQKKAYFDILNRKPQEQFLKESTIEGLKKKDKTLIYMLRHKIGVGKYFSPSHETEDQYIETLAKMVKEDVLKMPNRLLENSNIEKNSDNTFSLVIKPDKWKGGENNTPIRNTWAWYRGIEY